MVATLPHLCFPSEEKTASLENSCLLNNRFVFLGLKETGTSDPIVEAIYFSQRKRLQRNFGVLCTFFIL